MATIEVKLFAVLRDRFGSDAVRVEVSDKATASDVLARLRETYPEHGPHLSACRLAVNRRFAQLIDPVGPADEVALIPPVSGG